MENSNQPGNALVLPQGIEALSLNELIVLHSKQSNAGVVGSESWCEAMLAIEAAIDDSTDTRNRNSEERRRIADAERAEEDEAFARAEWEKMNFALWDFSHH